VIKTFQSNLLLRFLIVGGVNTAFGLATYVLLALTPLPTWAVIILSNAAGILFNFLTTGGLVFRDRSLGRLPRFLACYAVTFLLYLVFIRWLSPFTGGRIGAMLVIILPMTVLTYLLQSKIVFRVQS